LNIPKTIGAAISSGKANLRDCQDFYSIRDIYNMLEIITVDAHNAKIAEKMKARK
jgi:hypothetical protein